MNKIKMKRLVGFGLALVLTIGISAKAIDISSIDKEALTYEESVTYLSVMVAAAEDGSEEALLEGAAAEIQRNKKIEGMDLDYETTSFFEDYDTAEEIAFAIKVFLSDEYYVTARALNYRAGPGTDFAKYGSFSYGTVLSALEEYGDWYYVTDGTDTGWCDASFLELYDDDAEAALSSSESSGGSSSSDSYASSSSSYTDDDLYWLAVAINKEAGCNWLSDTHQLLVGNVILNRVASSSYPNTIYDVLHQQGQYPWATRGSYSEPTSRALENAQRLLDGERFCPDNVVYQSTATQGSGTYTSIYDSTLGTTTYFCYR